MSKGNKNKWWLNGGRGSGRTFRLLWETYENKIADLQHKVDTLQGFLDHDIEYDMDKAIQNLKKENAELEKELKDANEKVVHLACNQNKDLKCNLTKAKEIIKILLQYDRGQIFPNKIIYDKYMRIRSEAEQFIKEIEK